MKIGEIMFYKEQKSRNALKAAVALFIMLMPAIMAVSGSSVLNYAAVAIAMMIAVWRRTSSGKINISVVQLPVAFLLLFSLISSFWTQNREGHLNYIVTLIGLILFSTVALDYFLISKEENMQRRLFYMITVAGVICAVGNIAYSIIGLFAEIGETRAISIPQQSSAVGIFMLASIWCCRKILRDCAGKNKRILNFATLIMVIVFGMAKSVPAIVFAFAFAVVYLLNKKKEFAGKAVVTGVAVLLVIICACLSVACYGGGAVFLKAIMMAMRNPFGIGGGALISGSQMYGGELALNTSSLGTMALVASASGFAGVIVCTGIILWTVFIFSKQRSTVSLFSMMLTACLMFMPVADNFAIIMLWGGVLVYNDMDAAAIHSHSIRRSFSTEKICACAAIAAVLMFLALHGVMRYKADLLYRSGKYSDAVKMYNVTSKINFTDSKSCYMAAVAMRKSGAFDVEKACAELDAAKKRCKNDVSITVERAVTLYTAGKYDLSAQQWEVAVNMAPYVEHYRINYAKALYAVIKSQEKGSSKAKENYDKITALAANTENLDTKKQINDIADRAYKYTRSNQIIMQEETE